MGGSGQGYRNYYNQETTSESVTISTRTDSAEDKFQQMIRSQNLFNRNSGSNRGRGNNRGNFRGRGGRQNFNNYFANQTYDRDLVRQMTDDGHRPSRKFQIRHTSIYKVN